MTEVVMPRYGWTMTEGKIVQWLKREGDSVRSGEPLLIIESEKTQIEVEAEASGILRRILRPEGASVPIAQPIAIIDILADQLQDASPAATPPTAPAAQITPTGEESKIHETSDRATASPRAKRLAEKHGISLAQIRGTGPNSLIVSEDVIKLVKSGQGLTELKTEQAASAKKVALTGRRKAIADRMAASSRSAAAVTITTEADVSEAAELLKRLREESHVDITYTDLLARTVAKALQEHPLLNSVWQGDLVLIPNEINLGIAVADQNGLIVPVIKNAEKKTLREIAQARLGIVERVSEGKLAAEESVGSTFTITNLGMYGVGFFTPIMNFPENAILGVGLVTEKPLVINGQISARSVMPLSLSFDHRVIDGAPAAIFLRRLKELLERPASLL